MVIIILWVHVIVAREGVRDRNPGARAGRSYDLLARLRHVVATYSRSKSRAMSFVGSNFRATLLFSVPLFI